MNGARSIFMRFMRKGYWLTALATAVLLAASSGTAYAQSVGFDKTSGTLMEEAAGGAMTPAPLELLINVSGLTLADMDATPAIVGNAKTALGVLMIVHDADMADPMNVLEER